MVLVVDVFNDFDHEDGGRLLESFRRRAPAMARMIALARTAHVPVVYANDAHARWDGDARILIESALAGPGGDVIGALVPRPGEPLVLKHRYSAFDHTPLELLLESRHARRIVVFGAATEGCVTQTAIDARELGLKASIVLDACATVDPELEEIALRYAARVGGIHLVGAP